MARALGALLVIIALLLAAIAYLLFERRLSASLSSDIRPTISEQRECAAQAEHVFVSLGWKLSGGMSNGMLGSYSNHFNARLNRCFMLLQVSSYGAGLFSNSITVSDAFEGTAYAAFMDATEDHKPARVLVCKLTIPNKPVQRCAAKEDWQRLTAPYIETGDTRD